MADPQDGSPGGTGSAAPPEPLDRHRDGDPLLSVRDLRRHYPVRSAVLGRHVDDVRAVDGVSLDLYPGETLAVVGESGCGKSTLARTVLHLDAPTDGAVWFRGDRVGGRDRSGMRAFRRSVQPVFQDPGGSLNDRMRIGRAVREPLEIHDVGEPADRRERVRDLLETVGLDPDRYADRYPEDLSGGQQQRVAIARALALDPDLLVADEPTSALDVSVRARILSLLSDLQAERGLAYLLVTHDASVVRQVADRVAVMYLGRLVEVGDAEAVLDDPAHPYTEALLSNVPRVSPTADRSDRIALDGSPPDPADPPEGCHFHPRCHLKADVGPAEARRCETEDPEPTGDRDVACHFRPDDGSG
ncbi:MAG: ABC transporter ATP-binding protein [Halobacteriaceae archaeon]